MKNVWYSIISSFQFYWRAQTKFNVQSTFLHDFVQNVWKDDRRFYVFETIESARKRLLQNHKELELSDYGAGSRINQKKTIASITQISASQPDKAQLLFRIINHFQPKASLELGTNVGISSSYISSALSTNQLISIEGDSQLATIAANLHQSLGLANCKIVVGNFDDVLPSIIANMPPIDFVFLDGNHQYSQTKKYFEQILHSCSENAIIVLDDIYWSKGMTKAWKECSLNSSVTLSIDLYNIGLLFLSPTLSKQHISLIPYWMKPWKIGLFG